MRSGIAAVDIGIDIRRNQVAETDARGPSILHLDRAGEEEALILECSAQTAELTVCKDAGYPAAVELPVVAGAYGTEPAVTTHTLIDRKGWTAWKDLSVAVSIPDAATRTAEDIETGPARRHHRGRSLRICASGKVGRVGRSDQCGHRRESEQNLFHLVVLKNSGS